MFNWLACVRVYHRGGHRSRHRRHTIYEDAVGTMKRCKKSKIKKILTHADTRLCNIIFLFVLYYYTTVCVCSVETTTENSSSSGLYYYYYYYIGSVIVVREFGGHTHTQNNTMRVMQSYNVTLHTRTHIMYII